MVLENIKVANKDAKIYIGRSTAVHNLTLRSNYVKILLCFVQGQGQKIKQNIQQKALSGFITIPVYDYLKTGIFSSLSSPLSCF